METIGERIAKARKAANLNQRELCALADITEVSLSRYENGSRQPKAEILGKLAEVLNVSTDYLIGITDVMYNETPTNLISSNNIEDLVKDAESWLREGSVMCSGKPISEKAIDKIVTAIKLGVMMAEQENE